MSDISPESERTSASPFHAIRTRAIAIADIVAQPGRLRPPLTQFAVWVSSSFWRSFASGILTLGAMVLAANWWWGSSGPARLTALVQQGPFEVKIVENGTLQALQSITYSSSIPGNQAKIVYLIPEGSQVSVGDTLIRFDAEPFSEELAQTQAQLAQAEAELIKAREEVKLLHISADEEVKESRDKVRLAELELVNVMEGKGKLAEAESAAHLAQAKRELEKARSSYEDLKPLLEEGFITKLELERARQEVDKATENLELLEIKHRTYVVYTRPAEIEGSRSSFNNSRESLRQSHRAAESRKSQTEAALRLALSKREELTSKTEQQSHNLGQTEIRATVSGLVIYKDVFFGSEKRKVQIGDQVWPNQPLIMLPDLSHLTVDSQVRETDIYKVAKDQEVVVAVDAYPELRLKGKVSFIGTLAQGDAARRGGKYFSVTVLLDDRDPRLRPGMTTRVELLVERLQKALYVPVESVFQRAGRQYAYVMNRGRPRPREVLVGPSNEHHVVIETGLEVGERVLLGNPEDVSEGRGDLGSDFLDVLTPSGDP